MKIDRAALIVMVQASLQIERHKFEKEDIEAYQTVARFFADHGVDCQPDPGIMAGEPRPLAFDPSWESGGNPKTRDEFHGMMAANFSGILSGRIRRLADDMGFAYSTIERWIEGRSAPHPAQWPVVAQWLRDLRKG